jgi:hypothetical protein
MSARFTKFAWASALFTAAVALGSAGCRTEAFCFADCGDAGTNTGTGGHGNSTGSGGGNGGDCGLFGCSSSSSSGTGGGDGGPCVQTNGGVEICDGLDNDCNGTVDDIVGLDPTDPKTCGTCSNNCYAVPGSNWDPATVKCNAGTCSGGCTSDYFDLNNDGLCEYYCVKSANDDKTCNNKDDDCDGLVDEDVDLCTSLTDCGACGHNCSLPHATPLCVHTGSGACDASNTQCQIQACDCNGPNDCWHDLDKSAATGCEYPCFPTGPEICGDGIDNDCDGLIDEADDLSQDPQIGVTCQGGTKGVCADTAHAGVTKCISHQVVCDGPNVIKPGDLPETCNNVDDDCDGAVDNNPTDVGGACDGGDFFPCQKGTYQCQGGAKVCVGAVNPQPETCDGIDNDCDGVIDNNLPSAQNGAPCNVPTPPPTGATSPCKQGTTMCAGGTVQCVGSVGPTSTTDTCGVDANCDGQLTNQPALSDIHNCGACGNDCLAGSVHANWACVQVNGNFQCQFQGCQPGFYDNGGPGDAMAGDNKCGYACTFASAQETCNGKDDNCDGQIDEPAALVVPSVTQVCGVSPSATAPECQPFKATSNPGGVSLSCMNGAWKCTFNTAQVCNPTCATAAELCDNLDNNCNGLKNETTPNFGQPCASDDGKAAPGDGACRTTGTFICDPADTQKKTTICSVKGKPDLTKAGPELCDGIDNDCDGLVDETFNNKGSNMTYFVKPAVTKIANNLWIYSFEASRPSANTQVPGSGNGYWCSGASCATGIPTSPAGVTLDKTPACSVQGKVPWFNVTPIEVEQTCDAMGGHVCTTLEWATACTTKPPGATTCRWGYAPNGSQCTTALGGQASSPFLAYSVPYPTTGSRFCNLGPTYDFDNMVAGDQDGLLVTGSASLKNCYADWTALLSNGTTNGKIFDITGNLREITTCKADAAACTSTTECCSRQCVNGTCGCKGANATCTAATDCCSGTCTGGKCAGGVAGTTPKGYPAMGGAFDTQDETGAECSFDFYTVDQSFQLYDLGFRCCFSQDPTL